MSGGVGARATYIVQSSEAAPSRENHDVLSNVRDYISLTKPRIISLLLLTTVTTMFVADPAGHSD